MQNIPGLSFFDGLTKSRHPTARHSPGSNLSSPGSPLVDTPLKDAGPFSRLKTAKSTTALRDPLSMSASTSLEHSDDEDDNNPSDSKPFGDGDSSSGSTRSATASTSSLPATSFSRRAATVSASSSSSTPISSTPRASILPRSIENIFADPKSTTKTASASSSTRPPARSARRPSEANEKNNPTRSPQEPTAEDIEKLDEGSFGYAMLDKIQKHPIELADIIRLLVAKKAMLVLPTAPLITDVPLDRAFFEDHSIIVETSQPESLFVTISGIQGVLQPSNIAILGLASGQDFTSRVSDAAGPLKRSFFDTLTKSNNNTASSLNRVQDVKIESTSKGPVIISIDSVGSIHAILASTCILRPDVPPAPPTPIVVTPATASTSALPLARSRRSNSRSSSISSVGNQERPALFATLRRSTNSSTTSALLSLKEDKDSVVPRTPKIATDLPLEWDNMVQDLESFVVRIRKYPHQDMDKYAHDFQRKYDDVRHRFEVYASQTGLNQRWSDNDYDEMQQWVEAWLCHELYPVVDFLHDEQLQAKIAALNFLDLTLEHLGFVLDSPADVEHIAQVVREGGLELQKLSQFKAPLDKLHVLMSSHRVVVDTLNRDPAVQSKLKEEKEKEKKEDTQKPVEAEGQGEKDLPQLPPAIAGTPTSSTAASKRRSIPRIMMDEGFQDKRASIEGARSPRILMDGDENDPSNFSAFKLGTPVDDREATPAVTSTTPMDDKSEPLNESPKQEEAEVVSAYEDKEEPTVEQTATEEKTEEAVEGSQATLDTPIAKAEENKASGTSGNNSDAVSISGKHYSADVLLPLLIFSVVKSNPPNLIANLRFIQRFRVQDQLSGESAYCLTNMMAVVSFLEELDPQALGLSNHVRVMSDMTDLQQQQQPQASLRLHAGHGPSSSAASPLVQLQEGIDQTRALGQELVDAAEEGLKVISDVVQDGYSKFFGRFLTATDGLPISAGRHRGGGRAITSSTATAKALPSLPETGHESMMVAKTASTPADLISRAGPALTGEVSGTSRGGELVEKSSIHETAMGHAARSRMMDLLASSNGPMLTYMACTDAGDLRIYDIQAIDPIRPGASLILAWQIKNKHVVIIGGGFVAAGRLVNVLEADANVTIIAPDNEELSDTIRQHLVDHSTKVRLVPRHFRDTDLSLRFGEHRLLREDEPPISTPAPALAAPTSEAASPEAVAPPVDMVLSALDDIPLSTHIYHLSKQLKIPVNIADVPPQCDFYFCSTHRDQALQVAVSTSGKGPKMANLIRRHIAEHLPDRVGDAIERVSELRALLRKHAPRPEQGPKRMQWMSRVCEQWKIEDLAELNLAKIEIILEGFEANQVYTVKQVQAKLDERNGVESATEVSKNGEVVEADKQKLKEKARLVLVGAGPGDPELLTRKAARLLAEADLVVADRLIPMEVIDLAKGEVRIAPKKRSPVSTEKAADGSATTTTTATKSTDTTTLKSSGSDEIQDQLNAWCLEGLEQGKLVVRLKQGDPFIFGRGAEELLFFREHGFQDDQMEVVPGISSALSAPLAGRVPVTHRGHSDQVVITTAQAKGGVLPTNFPTYDAKRTVVILMGVGKAKEIADRMMAEDLGWPKDVPVVIVENAHCPQERVLDATLDTLAQVVEQHKAVPPAVFVVGWAGNVLRP
ncbi:hypothetical protein BGZ73_001801 [Actinomortierella ambigua]|nr:hypothetical protein BGZ73_001801 [Actinomortierella ambigua]